MNLRDNPFECDDVAASGFWTDQSEALSLLRRKLAGRSPLVIVSPRRCGMGGLVRQAIAQTGQRAIFVNVLMALSAAMLAELLLKAFLAVEPWERIRGALMKLRTKPVLTFNPENGGMEVAFGSAAKGSEALEDVLGLIAQASEKENHLIMVLDQFQAAADLGPGTEKRLRALMAREESISCVLLVSEESRAATLFENPQSPFFHFGTLLRFEPIAEEDFSALLVSRLEEIRGKTAAEDARTLRWRRRSKNAFAAARQAMRTFGRGSAAPRDASSWRSLAARSCRIFGTAQRARSIPPQQGSKKKASLSAANPSNSRIRFSGSGFAGRCSRQRSAARERRKPELRGLSEERGGSASLLAGKAAS